MRVKEVVDIMYSPDNFSPPPMEDMSPTTGINSSLQFFEERVHLLFFSNQQNRLCKSDDKIFYIVHLVSVQNLQFCGAMFLFETDTVVV